MILRFELIFLPFVALNFNCNLLKDVFIIEPFPWFCIDYLDWGDVLLFRVPFEEHPSSLKTIIFSPSIRFFVCKDWMIYVRLLGQEMKTYLHIGGCSILCETHLVEVQSNALISI
jgi:hypothetical protein